jgi:hypothetical protein
VHPGNAWFPGTADWPEPKAAQATPPRRSDRDRPRTSDGSNDRGPTPPRSWRPDPAPEAEEPEADQRGQGRFWNTEHQETDTDEHRFSKLREAAFDRFIANSATLHAAHYTPEKPYLRERVTWVLRWLLWVLACGLAPMPLPLTARERGPKPAASQPIPAQSGPAIRAQDTDHTGARSADGSTKGLRPQRLPAQFDRSGHATAARDVAVDRSDHVAAKPGAALAAAVNGARTARAVIAARGTSTNGDLAAAVRDSAVRGHPARNSAADWRAHPRQSRPRPSPRPATGSYMNAWEQAFDAGNSFLLSAGGAA